MVCNNLWEILHLIHFACDKESKTLHKHHYVKLKVSNLTAPFSTPPLTASSKSHRSGSSALDEVKHTYFVRNRQTFWVYSHTCLVWFDWIKLKLFPFGQMWIQQSTSGAAHNTETQLKRWSLSASKQTLVRMNQLMDDLYARVVLFAITGLRAKRAPCWKKAIDTITKSSMVLLVIMGIVLDLMETVMASLLVIGHLLLVAC